MWPSVSRSHSQSNDDRYTPLPPRSTRSQAASDRLEHIGRSVGHSAKSSRSESFYGPPVLQPVSNQTEPTRPFTEDPNILPWICLTQSPERSPEQRLNVPQSRFSSFSTQVDSKRGSTASAKDIAPPTRAVKRQSGLRQQLTRAPSTASSASIWSSSTGLTEQTFEPQSETEASSRFLKRHPSFSNSSTSSFRSSRVSLFRQRLSEGHVPARSVRSTSSKRPTSWESVDAQDRRDIAQASSLLKQRLSADLNV